VFYRHQRPPANWLIWAGHCKDWPPWDFYHRGWGVVAKSDATLSSMAERCSSQTTTFKVGQLLLHTYSTTASVIDVDPVVFALKHGLCPLWPQTTARHRFDQEMKANGWARTLDRRHVGVVHSAGILRGPRTSPSHGENRGSSPLGSASKIKLLMQVGQLVSNNCPINVYGQAWTACSFLDWTTCAVRVALPLLAPLSRQRRNSNAVHLWRFSYSQTSWLLTRGGSESLGESRLPPSIPKRRAFDGPDGGTG